MEVPQSETEMKSESAAPVSTKERIHSVDAVRGLAVLGILLMNIPFFSMPMEYGSNPTRIGEHPTLNSIAWLTGFVLFEGKMRCLFSMLFGAGFIILSSRTEQRGLNSADIYIRRTMWLMFFGLLHAYFLWNGDILFWYGALGLLLYPLRNLRGWTLIIIGLLLAHIMVARGFYARHEVNQLEQDAKAAMEAEKAGEKPTEEQQVALRRWRTREARLRGELEPESEKRIAKNINDHLKGYWHIFKTRFRELAQFHAIGLYQVGIDDVLAIMMIGMGLFKIGFFSGLRSYRFYWLTLIFGYGIGLSFNSYLAYLLHTNHYARGAIDMFYFYSTHSIDRISIALAHASVIILLCKSGIGSWLTYHLSKVGQMALTNYIMHSAICTTIFYGYGLGLYARYEYYELIILVFGIWLFQMFFSRLWLGLFRFGPLEWLWRSLTYLKVQKIR